VAGRIHECLTVECKHKDRVRSGQTLHLITEKSKLNGQEKFCNAQPEFQRKGSFEYFFCPEKTILSFYLLLFIVVVVVVAAAAVVVIAVVEAVEVVKFSQKQNLQKTEKIKP